MVYHEMSSVFSRDYFTMIEERQLLVKLKRDSLFSQFNGKCMLINLIKEAIAQRVIDILACTEYLINQIFMMQHIIIFFW